LSSPRAVDRRIVKEGRVEAGRAVLTLRGRLLADAVVRELVG
jgi:hypothetical protein